MSRAACQRLPMTRGLPLTHWPAHPAFTPHGMPALMATVSNVTRANNRKLLTQLQSVPDGQRSAQFHCVLVYLRHVADPVPIVCHGRWHGRILHAPAGEGGFGYDPLFYVPDLQCSSAQLSAAQKNQISHRARAMQMLLQQLTSQSLSDTV